MFQCHFQCTDKDDINQLIEAGSKLCSTFEETEQIKSLMDTEPRPWDRHFLLAAQLCLLSDSPNYLEALAILGKYLSNRSVFGESLNFGKSLNFR